MSPSDEILELSDSFESGTQLKASSQLFFIEQAQAIRFLEGMSELIVGEFPG
ncbi:MAG TPA: hypothetical protein PKD47_00675 [Solirubrobacterales bacterium]|nr:hypothetical protein [Solirubrobacterales bacterium]HNG57321.1 hypothetical protein [Solirubrobacterales bacterium]